MPASGLVVPIYKARGMGSTSVVAQLKRAGKFPKIGHGGTLDPLAEGVLPILIGPAARLTDQLHELTKSYLAAVLFGVATTTEDLAGEVISSSPQTPAPYQVRNALNQFGGTIQQIPSAYSAIHVNGRRAHQLARAGQAVQIPPRTVKIFAIGAREFAVWSNAQLAACGLGGLIGSRSGRLLALIEVECSKGTYIRALARDLGQVVGTGAVLVGLLRTRVGPLAASDCLSLAQAKILAAQGALHDAGFAADRLLGDVAPLILPAQSAYRFSNGVRFTVDHAPGRVRVYSDDGQFLGLGQIGEDRRLRPWRVLAAA